MSQARYLIMPTMALEDDELTEIDLRVLAAIGSFLDKDAEAWPSQQKIADVARKSRPRVNESIKKLEDRGYITIKRDPATALKRSLKYRVNLDPETIKSQRLSLFCRGNIDVTSEGNNDVPYNVTTEDTHKKIPNNKNIQKDLSPIVERFWSASPKAGKSRTSKLNIRKALQKLLKADSEIDFERLLAAWNRYLESLKAEKKLEYTKGCHSWLNNQMFDAWMPEDPPNIPGGDDGRMGDLEWCFNEYAQGKKWPGAHFGFDLEPGRERADYPAELYEKYNIKKFGEPVS